MFSFLLVLTVSCASVLAGYAGSSSSSAGNGVDGTGYGYGFSGSTQGSGAGAGTGFGNFPQPPIFDFNSFLNAYFESLRKYHEQFQTNMNSYAYTSNDPNSRAEAQSSIIYDQNYIGNNPGSNSLQAAHQNAVSGYGFPGGFPAFTGAAGHPGAGANFAGGFGGSFQGTPETGGAVASGGIGPDGGFQSAAVYPENPNNPNIFNRFGGAEGEGQGQGQTQGQGQGQPNGFYGVFTSSHSSSSDVDGKKTQVHEAQTTINDNGKVTTYKVKNP